MAPEEPVIHIRPVEGWSYFNKNRARLSDELVEIATSESKNTSVYMTEEDGNPYLYVYRDDKKVFQSACNSAYETERNLRVIYAQYLSDLEVVNCGNADEDGTDGVDEDLQPNQEHDDTPPVSDLDEMDAEEFQRYIDEREDVILKAVTDMIAVLTEEDITALVTDPADESSLSNIVEHIVEHLAIKCGLRIRRPMTVIEDDTGLEVRTEYPYEEYDFSEEELHG